jgi:hypothetical protein
MTALEEPYWLGVQPILEQRITGLRLIWPDDVSLDDMARDMAASVASEATYDSPMAPMAMPATVYGRSARRYAHLAVIDGGRQ